MAEKMKAQVFYESEKMELEEIPVPRVSDIDVLVKVKNCGVCGSDISYYYGLSARGHASGQGTDRARSRVHRRGRGSRLGARSRMKLFAPGDRVVVNPVQHCNACYACASGHTNLCTNLFVPGVTANGGLAEYCVSRYTGLFKLPGQRQLRRRRVHRAVRLRGVRRQEARHRAGAVRRHLRAGGHGPDDDPAVQVHGRGQGRLHRHARLPPGGREEVGRRLPLQHEGHEVEVLREGSQEGHRGRDPRHARRPGDRAHELQRGFRAGHRRHRQRGHPRALRPARTPATSSRCRRFPRTRWTRRSASPGWLPWCGRPPSARSRRGW